VAIVGPEMPKLVVRQRLDDDLIVLTSFPPSRHAAMQSLAVE
jgi:hypothetical protein